MTPIRHVLSEIVKNNENFDHEAQRCLGTTLKLAPLDGQQIFAGIVSAAVGDDDGDENKGGSAAGTTSVILPFQTFVGIGAVCFFIFCLVRNHFKDIYSPRRVLKKGRPPKLSSSFLGWVSGVWNVRESFLVSTVGLDAVMFLRFLRTGIKLFSLLAVLGLSVIAPVNFFSNPPTEPLFSAAKPFNETAFLKHISIENVTSGSPFLRVHLVCTWLFSILAYGFLIDYYRGHVQLKMKYVEHVLRKTKLSKIEHRSIMVYSIPSELRNEVELAAYFESLGIGGVEQVVIVRKWAHLREAVMKRAYYLTKLEHVYCQVYRTTKKFAPWSMRKPGTTPLEPPNYRLTGSSIMSFRRIWNSIRGVFCKPKTEEHEPLLAEEPASPRSSHYEENVSLGLRSMMDRIDMVDGRHRPHHRLGLFGIFGERVDSAQYYAKEYLEWDAKVSKYRRTADDSPATTVGFVSFESPESATLASQILIHRQPFACSTCMAPEPRDINWDNLASKISSPLLKLLRSTIVLSVLAILIIFSTTFIVVISAFLSLDSIATVFPSLKPWIDSLAPTTKDYIQTIVPPVLSATWTGSLPSVLLVATQLQGLEAVSWIEMSVLSKYSFYQVWNIFFVPVASNSVIAELIKNPGSVIELLGRGVIRMAMPLINYVMLLGLVVYPAMLLLVFPLAMTWMMRALPWSGFTPRAVSDAYYPSTLTSMNYGIIYPLPILVFIIGIVYSPVQPIILPFCVIFFSIAYFMFKYIFLYVHIPTYETGGMQAPMAVRRCFWGMFIMQLTLMGLLATKSTTGREGDHGFGVTQLTHRDIGSGLVQSVYTAFADVGFRWNSYVQMVLSILPLTFIIFGLLWWMSNGYDKLVQNTPMDLVASVAREFGGAKGTGNSGPNGLPSLRSPPAPMSARSSWLWDRAIGAASKELGIVKAKRRMTQLESENVNSGSGKEHRSRGLEIGSGGPEHVIETAVEAIAETLTDVVDDHPEGGLLSPVGPIGSVLNKISNEDPPNQRPEAVPTDILFAEPESDGEDNSTTQGKPSVSDAAVGSPDADDAHYIDIGGDGIGVHLEPPMTRVIGVLDAPVSSATPVVFEGDEQEQIWIEFLPRGALTMSSEGVHYYFTTFDDLQIHTYLHPALIGRLPVFWLPNKPQPEPLREAREEQAMVQRDLWKKVVLRQRMGVRAMKDKQNGGTVELERDQLARRSTGATTNSEVGHGAEEDDGEDAKTMASKKAAST
ncbi:hypothetical protein BJ742DRAFT_708380 [Cladochytrium replicatum]|nr:hypothetical protein BJ742DRAFT_708380 [Cladochytrium replicatum]